MSAGPAPVGEEGVPAASTTRVRVLPHPALGPQGAAFDARQGRKLVDELLARGVQQRRRVGMH